MKLYALMVTIGGKSGWWTNYGLSEKPKDVMTFPSREAAEAYVLLHEWHLSTEKYVTPRIGRTVAKVVDFSQPAP